MSYEHDLDVEYEDSSGDLEIEIEHDDPGRALLDGGGRRLLEHADRSQVLEILGR